jgi:F0F1-type ATP synthase membrane subunit a
MPHEETWFSLLPFHARFLAFARNFSKPFSDDGHTWYAHQTPGVQHIYAAMFVLGLIVIISVVTDTSIRAPTSNFNTTLGCGIVIFITTHIYGLKVNGWNHVKHLFGPKIGIVWLPLMLLMFVIELISHIARPLSLGIRLMANMTADHLVLTIFTALVPFLIPVPMYLLGAVVVVVQTLVFCLLSSVYIGMSVEEAAHH